MVVGVFEYLIPLVERLDVHNDVLVTLAAQFADMATDKSAARRPGSFCFRFVLHVKRSNYMAPDLVIFSVETK